MDATNAAAPAKTPAMISIDGHQWALDQLSAEARSLLESLQAVDQEMARLQMQQAICQTARNAYLQALRNALPAESA